MKKTKKIKFDNSNLTPKITNSKLNSPQQYLKCNSLDRNFNYFVHGGCTKRTTKSTSFFYTKQLRYDGTKITDLKIM